MNLLSGRWRDLDLSEARLKRLAVRYLLPPLLVWVGVMAYADFSAYVRVWAGEGTRGVFIAEGQPGCGGMPPVPVEKCPWEGTFVSADGRIRRADMELAGPAADREKTREGTTIAAVDTAHSRKVFAAAGGTDRPVLEVAAMVACAGSAAASLWWGWVRGPRRPRPRESPAADRPTPGSAGPPPRPARNASAGRRKATRRARRSRAGP